MADDDDEDMGTSFMRQHMSEAQPSSQSGALGDKSRNTATPGTDSYYENRYGKDTNLGPSTPTTVNRSSKGAKDSGTIGTDEWVENKYGGDGMTGGRKPKASQRDKNLKY